MPFIVLARSRTLRGWTDTDPDLWRSEFVESFTEECVNFFNARYSQEMDDALGRRAGWRFVR